MKLKTILDEIKRIRAGYKPKTNSFGIWLLSIITRTLSIIALRIRTAFE